MIQGTYHPFDAYSAIGLNYTLNIRKCGSNDIAWLLTVEDRRGTVRIVKNREADALTLG